MLGANISDILLLLSRDFLRWVLVVLLLAAPLAWIFARRWLEGFAFHLELDYMLFLAPAMLLFLIATLTVSYQAWHSARINPAETLKNE